MKLSAYLKKQGFGATSRLARALGVNAVMISQYKQGKRPGAITAIEIDRHTEGKVSAEEMRPDLAKAFRYLRANPRKR